MDSDIEELETYNSLSYSLTYTKPLSGRSNATAASDYTDSFEQPTHSSATSYLRDISQQSSSKVSYSEDFTTPTLDSLHHSPTGSYSSNFADSHKPISQKSETLTSSQCITKTGNEDKSQNASHTNTSTDSYSTQFDSLSQTHSNISEEYSKTSSRSPAALSTYSYSSDLQLTEEVSEHPYGSDFESASQLTDSDTQVECYTSPADSYYSDFEDSDEGHRSDKVEKQHAEEMYEKAMLKALHSTDDSNRRQAWREIEQTACLMKQARDDPPAAKDFIVNSLARLKSAQKDLTLAEPASLSESSAMTSRQGPNIPDDHPFIHRLERLKMDNFFIRLQQQQNDLDEEILKHEEFVRKSIAPHQARMFALPRKVRLEKDVFISKLEDHQTRMNSVAMIGDIAKDLPKHSEGHEAIWEKLMNTAQRRGC
ncbi:uro-adherence factor A-like [Watersipora subatra]|uniref:uro-adherence factor A-like n=1 Tax=Watersipora subatra TaxID=2589382 RepID=UPI00355C54B2